MHDELAAILAAAAAAGIEVMPLKGALLTTMPGCRPVRRPMADLDLLVHPPDRAGDGRGPARARLRGASPSANPRPTHDVFLDPAGVGSCRPRASIPTTRAGSRSTSRSSATCGAGSMTTT